MEQQLVCKYFLKGQCKFGNECKNSHERPVCKYHATEQGCKRGDSCRYRHPETPKYFMSEKEAYDKVLAKVCTLLEQDRLTLMMQFPNRTKDEIDQKILELGLDFWIDYYGKLGKI